MKSEKFELMIPATINLQVSDRAFTGFRLVSLESTYKIDNDRAAD